MRCRAFLGPGLSLALAIPLLAGEPDARLQFGGFGTFGAAFTDSHQVAYPRDTSAYLGAEDYPTVTEDSRLGLQGHLKLGQTLGATLQVVSQYRYNGTYMPDITKAELVWNPVLGTQVHAGRMNYESHLDQNVGYDYLWVRPPVEVYSALAVGVMDGVDVSQALPLGGKAILVLKAYGGTSAGRIAVWRVGTMNFNGGREFGLVTAVLDGPWRIAFSGGQIIIPSEFPAPLNQLPADFDLYAGALADPRLAQSGSLFSIKGAVERGWGTTVTYADDRVQLEGQFTRTYTNRWLLAPVASGCLYMGYKAGKVEPYVMWARTLAQPLRMPYVGAIPYLPDPASQAFVPGITRFLQGLDRNQYTWSAGERWDFASWAAFKAQIDWVHSAQGASPLSPVPTGFQGNLKVFTMLVDFKFGKEAVRGFAD
jgi:hypothetical protein